MRGAARCVDWTRCGMQIMHHRVVAEGALHKPWHWREALL